MVRTLLVTVLMAMAATAGADIYKWTDKDGVVHFGDNATGARKAEKVEVREVTTFTHVTYEKRKALPTTTAAGSKPVILYGTTWCGYCKKARAYFRAHDIAFTDLDVESDASAKAQFQAMGGRGVPVILVGDTRINGFSAGAFENVYKPR